MKIKELERMLSEVDSINFKVEIGPTSNGEHSTSASVLFDLNYLGKYLGQITLDDIEGVSWADREIPESASCKEVTIHSKEFSVPGGLMLAAFEIIGERKKVECSIYGPKSHTRPNAEYSKTITDLDEFGDALTSVMDAHQAYRATYKRSIKKLLDW